MDDTMTHTGPVSMESASVAVINGDQVLLRRHVMRDVVVVDRERPTLAVPVVAFSFEGETIKSVIIRARLDDDGVPVCVSIPAARVEMSGHFYQFNASRVQVTETGEMSVQTQDDQGDWHVMESLARKEAVLRDLLRFVTRHAGKTVTLSPMDIRQNERCSPQGRAMLTASLASRTSSDTRIAKE